MAACIQKHEKFELLYFLNAIFTWKHNKNYIYYPTQSVYET